MMYPLFLSALILVAAAVDPRSGKNTAYDAPPIGSAVALPEPYFYQTHSYDVALGGAVNIEAKHFPTFNKPMESVHIRLLCSSCTIQGKGTVTETINDWEPSVFPLVYPIDAGSVPKPPKTAQDTDIAGKAGPSVSVTLSSTPISYKIGTVDVVTPIFQN